MNRFILFASIILFSTHLAYSQQTFRKALFPGGDVEWEATGTQCDNGDYIIAATSAISNGANQRDIKLIRLNAAGDTIRTKLLVKSNMDETATMIRQTSDKGFIITGSLDDGNINGTDRLYIVKTDSLCNLQWEQAYGYTGSWVYGIGSDIIEIPGKSYVAVGRQFSSSSADPGMVRIVKVDSLGIEQWTQLYYQWCSGSSIVYNPSDSGFTVAGIDRYNTSNAFAMRIDKAGTALWKKRYGTNSASQLIRTPNGYTVLSPSTITFINGQGDSIGGRRYILPPNRGFATMDQTFDGGYIIGGLAIDSFTYTGFNTKGAHYNYFLMRVNAQLDSVWSRMYTYGVNDDMIASVVQTADSGYFLCGTSDLIGWAVKTDKDGITYGCSSFGYHAPYSFARCPGDTDVLRIDFPNNVAYRYVWSRNDTLIPGANTSRYTAKAGGMFKLIVTDTISTCTDTFYFELKTSVPTTTISAGADLNVCYGNRSQSLTGTPNTGIWTGKDITSSSDKSINIATVGMGDHAYVYSVFQNGCYFTDTMIVSIDSIKPSAPAITVSGATAMCPGDSLVLTADSGYYRYVWYGNKTTQAIVAKSAGTYYVFAYSDHSCRSDTSMKVVVTIGARPSKPTIQGAADICSGQKVILTGPSGYRYRWSNGDTTRTTSVDTGLYTLRIASLTGVCFSDTDEVRISNRPKVAKPTVSVSGDTDLCEGETVTLTAPAGFPAYRWNNGETTRSIIVNSKGMYRVAVNNVNYCLSDSSDEVHVNVTPRPSKPAISSSASFVCGDDSARLAGPAGYRYLWSTGDTTGYIDMYTGTYSLRIAMLNSNCFSDTSSVEIQTGTKTPKPQITVNGQLCQGDSAQLTLAQSATHYVWSSGQTTSSIYIKTNGTYTVAVQTTGMCLSDTADPVTINFSPVPDQPVIVLAGSDSLDAGVAANSYEWTKDGSLLPQNTRRIGLTEVGSYVVRVKFEADCFSPVSTPYVYELPTGLYKPNEINVVNVYPNPVARLLYIELPANLVAKQIKVVNALGAEIHVSFSQTGATCLLATEHLSEGIYFVELLAGNNVMRCRFVKQ